MSKNGKKMCSTQNWIKMNNWAQTLTLSDIRTNFPHPRIAIWWTAHSREPFDESTWIMFSIVWKREKHLDACNIHPTHPRFVFILNYESAISARCVALPNWGGSDAFSAHPTKTAFITWRKKSCDSRVEYRDLTLNCWVVFKFYIIWCDVRIFVGGLLSGWSKKLAKQRLEVISGSSCLYYYSLRC